MSSKTQEWGCVRQGEHNVAGALVAQDPCPHSPLQVWVTAAGWQSKLRDQSTLLPRVFSEAVEHTLSTREGVSVLKNYSSRLVDRNQCLNALVPIHRLTFLRNIVFTSSRSWNIFLKAKPKRKKKKEKNKTTWNTNKSQTKPQRTPISYSSSLDNTSLSWFFFFPSLSLHDSSNLLFPFWDHLTNNQYPSPFLWGE